MEKEQKIIVAEDKSEDRMEYSKLQRRIVLGASVLSLLVLLAATIFLDDKLKFAYGIFFGTAISILMFMQTANALSKATAMTPHRAQKYVASRYIIRMLIYGTVLFVSLKADYINVIATLIGFLSVKVSVMTLSFAKKI